MTWEIALWLTKFVHLSTISVWAGGLLCLPVLISRNREKENVSLHRTVRFLYVGLISPAAFAAIASGTVLIFMQSTFNHWFAAKMLLVGVMAALHVVTGLRLVAVFSRRVTFRTLPAMTLTVFLACLMGTIFWIVLAKPDFDYLAFAADYMQPGFLGERYPVLKFWQNIDLEGAQP